MCVLRSVGIPAYTKRGSKSVRVPSILSGKKLFFFPLYFQSYIQVGFSIGHHISRKPPLGEITNRNASFTCFSNYFVMIDNDDPKQIMLYMREVVLIMVGKLFHLETYDDTCKASLKGLYLVDSKLETKLPES